MSSSAYTADDGDDDDLDDVDVDRPVKVSTLSPRFAFVAISSLGLSSLETKSVRIQVDQGKS
jgi:hypothetical protein